MQLSHKVFHARHLLFNQKQETGRSVTSSAPLALERSKKLRGSKDHPDQASFETIPSLYDRQEHHQDLTNMYNHDLP